MTDIPQEDEQVEGPQDFVVVLAYTSDDNEIEEDFGRLVNDIKALYTFKHNVRSYALVEQAAKNVLAKVEKPKGEPSNKGAIVISFDQPEDIDEAFMKMNGIASQIRDIFDNERDIEVRIAIRESADEVLSIFKAGG